METSLEYIQRYRIIYQKFQPVFSPALNAQVYFTSEGFNHLLFKHGRRRPTKQIKYRLPLIKLIIPAIKLSGKPKKVLKSQERYKKRVIWVTYFELNAIVGRKSPATIKVIIKKRGKDGKYFFFSVMKQKTPKGGRLLS